MCDMHPTVHLFIQALSITKHSSFLPCNSTSSCHTCCCIFDINISSPCPWRCSTHRVLVMCPCHVSFVMCPCPLSLSCVHGDVQHIVPLSMDSKTRDSVLDSPPSPCLKRTRKTMHGLSEESYDYKNTSRDSVRIHS